MKELIEKLLKEHRKTKAELATILKITYPGLQNKLINDTFKHNEILQLEEFFGVDKGYFDTDGKPVAEVKTEPTMWELAREQYEKRVEELSSALADARYTIQLQRKMLGDFKYVSKIPPVKKAYLVGMYVSQKNLMRA